MVDEKASSAARWGVRAMQQIIDETVQRKLAEAGSKGVTEEEILEEAMQEIRERLPRSVLDAGRDEVATERATELLEAAERRDPELLGRLRRALAEDDPTTKWLWKEAIELGERVLAEEGGE